MPENPARYQPGWPTAVIVVRHQTGVLGMRNLARRGVPVVCIDCDTSQVGFYEVYGKACECPNPDEDGPGWLKFMVELAAKLPSKPVLIAASDQFLWAVAVHAEELSRYYRIGAAPQAQGALSEKASLYALAEHHGMPIPRTGKVESEEDVRRFAATAQFPVLLKPISAREWDVFTFGHPLHLEKVAVADRDELMRHYQMVREASPVLSIQEIIRHRYRQGCLLRLLRPCGEANWLEPVQRNPMPSAGFWFGRGLRALRRSRSRSTMRQLSAQRRVPRSVRD